MKTLILAMACAAVLALGGMSYAAQISSPTIFGTSSQDLAHCVVLNGGTSALTVALKIVNDFGGTEATSNCSGPLGAGQFCNLVARVTDSGSGVFACIATAGNVTNLRGTLVLEEELPDPVFGNLFRRPIRSAPMR